MIAAAMVTLKQHRFEVAAAAALAVAVGLWAAWLVLQVSAHPVPLECLEAWAENPGGDDLPCRDLLSRWTRIVGGEPVVGMLAYLPFAVGLLGGVPIVARELETGSASTAWWLYPSRQRWLVGQLLPIVVVLGSAIAVAALTTGALEAHRAAVGFSPVVDLGMHGPLLLTRALGALGVALLVGALLGRTLPTLVVAAVLLAAMTYLASSARDAWQQALPPAVVAESSVDGGVWHEPRALITGVAYRSPAGEELSLETARAIAHSAGAPEPAIGDVQDLPAAVWLAEHGYIELSLGITHEMALLWANYDALIYGGTGLLGIVLTGVAIQRKRPT